MTLDLLECLLTDPRMELAWREIEKRLKHQLRPKKRSQRKTQRRVASVNTDFLRGWSEASPGAELTSQYWKLCKEIFYAVARSGPSQLEPRSRIRERFLHIERDVKKLAGAIAETRLDLPAYEFFPDVLANVWFKKGGTAARIPPLRWTQSRVLKRGQQYRCRSYGCLRCPASLPISIDLHLPSTRP